MAGLNINPLPFLVQKVDQGIQQAIAAYDEAKPKIGAELEKANLDAKVAQLSGQVGSGYNQASGAGGTFFDQINTGMGQVKDTVNSPLGNGSISSLTDGGTFGAIGDFAKGVGKDISGVLGKFSGGDLAGGFQDLAKGISKGAGALNDLLSLKRAENLPQNGELFKNTGQGITVQPHDSDDWRVRITCDWTLFSGNPLFAPLNDEGTRGVVFPILPQIQYSTKANYTSIDPIHNNYPFQAYKNSEVDAISIDGTFICENETQAAYWISSVAFFRTMTKMFFGQGANAGAPPPVCQLSGYGASFFDNVPVVVKSFSVDMPNDVNYIRCDKFGTNTWVPVTSSFSVQVQPVYNRRNLRQFSLTDYARGTLKTPSGQGYL